MSFLVLSARRSNTIVPASPATVLFADDFASGNLTHTENGISWTNTPFAQVVDLPQIARTGNTKVCKMRFGDSYDGVNPEGEPIAEIRWTGMTNQSEVFQEWYFYVPSGSESPSVGSWPTTPRYGNDKFFRTFQGDGNTNSLSSVGASTFTGAMWPEWRYNTGASLLGLGTWTDDFWVDPNPSELFTNAAYRGRWVRVRIRCKVATVANNDGVIQMWLDDVLIHNRTNLPNYAYDSATSTLGNWFNGGYILGAMNSYYGLAMPAGSAIYISGVTISTGGFTS